jgi:hypothetical protein
MLPAQTAQHTGVAVNPFKLHLPVQANPDQADHNKPA